MAYKRPSFLPKYCAIHHNIYHVKTLASRAEMRLFAKSFIVDLLCKPYILSVLFLRFCRTSAKCRKVSYSVQPFGKIRMQKHRTSASPLGALVILLALAACSLPRGAPLQSELISASKQAENPNLAVYSVTKSFLPVVASWPTARHNKTAQWISHKHRGAVSVIVPGDTVSLTIWDSGENSLLTASTQKVTQIDNILVSPGGTIFVPYVNKIKIAGMSTDSARAKIQTKLSTVIPSAQVQLTTTAGMKHSVSLVGGVKTPGLFPINDPHFTVLNLISMGGGVAENLNNPHVKLIRAGRTYGSSLDRIVKNPSLDSVLAGGDKVILQEDERYFRSLGAASKEQLFYFEEDNITALDAMALVGGLSERRADPKGILVLREYASNAVRADDTGPDNERSIFVIDLTSSDGLFSAGRFAIHSNDTLLITESPVTAINTVFGLIGSVFGIAANVN